MKFIQKIIKRFNTDRCKNCGSDLDTYKSNELCNKCFKLIYEN